MIPSTAVVDLSRIQFAGTALFHFLFVPLTLGLSWVMVIMEAAYLKTGKLVYKDMARFWGKLFLINFAVGVVGGLTLEFEFGLNWAYFSRYIGDTFGTALAIEGLSAFMVETTMLGIVFFAWDKIPKWAHFLATVLLALGTNMSIVNILAANSWMQHPVATYFDYQTMHMMLTSLWGVYISQLTQIRVGHVLFAGAMTASVFVLGVSAYYMLKKRDMGFARRSAAIAIGFGFVSMLAVAWFGDANGLAVARLEPQKMAAIEAVWTTPKAPAAWALIAWPDQAKQKNLFALNIPYGLSLIATHSLTGTVEGEKQIIAHNKTRVISGIKAYAALIKLREGRGTKADLTMYNAHKKDLGYALLLKQFDPEVTNASSVQIQKAANSTIPNVFVTFWSFRFMVGCWSLMLLLFFGGAFFLYRQTLHKHRWWLWCALLSIPLPYLASEFGWIVAEVGRQPWTVHGFLPTFLSTSSISLATIIASVTGFVVFYASLFILEIVLMFKYARLGPSALGEGRYYFEKQNISEREVK